LPVPAESRPPGRVLMAFSMITKDFIPEMGIKSFVIMNCLLKGLCPEVASASAG